MDSLTSVVAATEKLVVNISNTCVSDDTINNVLQASMDSLTSGMRTVVAAKEKLAVNISNNRVSDDTTYNGLEASILFPTRVTGTQVLTGITNVTQDAWKILGGTDIVAQAVAVGIIGKQECVAEPELSSVNKNVSWSDEIVAVTEPLKVSYFHEIFKIVTTINNHLHKARTNSSSSISKPWTICRVPKHLTDIHEHGFHPKLISIGPFHYCKTMEEHKNRLCKRLLNSLKLNSTTASTDESESSSQAITRNTEKTKSLADQMDKLHTHAKAWYSLAESDHSFTSQDFGMMLILDGCFVVQLLRLYSKCDEENGDPIFSTLWMLPKFQRDLLLLENQLPYIVLEKIFEITISSEEVKKETTLAQLALKFFDPLLPREENSLKQFITDAKGAEHDHLLDLFRSSFLSSFKVRKSTTDAIKIDVPKVFHLLDLFSSSFLSSFKDRKSTTDADYEKKKTTDAIKIDVPKVFEKINFIKCVSKLKEAGVVFKKRDSHLLDIKFKNGKLCIPPLSIDDHTYPLFMNFIAYEQCNIKAEPYFTHYLLFFDSLVNSSKDVEHLHYREIINHGLGSDEDVADLFNNLCKEVVHDVNSSYLSQVSKDVNRYFRIKRHTWCATWKHDYFRNPWAFLAFLGAIIILLLTTIQSFFAVFAYFRPPSSKPN